jgi:hypothetical protein
MNATALASPAGPQPTAISHCDDLQIRLSKAAERAPESRFSEQPESACGGLEKE